ncbi:MAG: hypothetical protein ACXABF_11365 [Candidatus Thorarchaeota archaeon]|jgi:hypothetical protein
MSAVLKKTAFSQGVNEVSTVQQERLGTLRILEDGRKFRYASINATIGAGKAVEAVAEGDANLIAQALPTIAANAKSFTFTPGGAVTYIENYFADGYAQVSEGTGLGQQWQIAGSGAEVAGTVLPIQLYEGVQTATDTTDSKGSVFPNPYHLVILAATITNPVMGIATQDLVAARFAWLQTGGHAVALITGTPAIGVYLIANATDGSLGIRAGAETSFHVGYVIGVAGATGKYYPVMLTID